MTSIAERVWSYKTFTELTPEAAQKAIKHDRLFSQELPWAKSMDPVMTDVLFYANGYPAMLTVTERAEMFPLPVENTDRPSHSSYRLQV